MFCFLGNHPVAIRFSWRRLAGNGTAGTGHGHETKRGPPVYRNVQRSDEQPQSQTDLRSIHVRSKSQREPPVIIGDPTVSSFSAFERRTVVVAKTQNPVMQVICAGRCCFCFCFSVMRSDLCCFVCAVGYERTCSRESEKDVISHVGPAG